MQQNPPKYQRDATASDAPNAPGPSVTAEPLETIGSLPVPFALIVRHTLLPDRTVFVTEPSFTQQIGFVVYGKGQEVPRHVHRSIPREPIGTSEVIMVRKGSCEVDIYDANRRLVATRRLDQGDVVVMISGGHGFRMIEDCVLLEVKQGPHISLDEKERF